MMRILRRTVSVAAAAEVYDARATDRNGLALDAFEMMTVKGGKFVPSTGK